MGLWILKHYKATICIWHWKRQWKSLSPVGLFATSWLHSPWNSPGQNTGVGSLSLLQGIFPTQGSNPGLLHCRWILYQLSHKGSPKILEWVDYAFSRGSSQPRNLTRVSCIASDSLPTELSGKPDYVWCSTQLSPTLCDPMDCSWPDSSDHGDSPGKNTGVGCHALLQGIFPIWELNQCLLHCTRILYQVSYQPWYKVQTVCLDRTWFVIYHSISTSFVVFNQRRINSFINFNSINNSYP